ncbi:MAG: acetolactate synthase small subunit [Proteobacteria bacterium]|nr:acetolactate synthase small subunit [Pseudomonadota bacterium]
MSAQPEPAPVELPPLHTLSLFVNNKPGVLVRVSLAFARRGFNIESLVVSEGKDERFSRITITCRGDRATLDQMVRQLAKLVDVVHAIDHTGEEAIEIEIALIKLEGGVEQRTQIFQIVEHYKAKVVDFGHDSLVLQVQGSSEKIDAFVELLRPFGILELVRSGKLLMARGRQTT